MVDAVKARQRLLPRRSSAGELDEDAPIRTAQELADLTTVSVDVQQTVPPDSTVPISVEAGNNAGFISPFDPNVCTVNFFNGYLLEVEAEVDGVALGSEEKCVNTVDNAFYNFSWVTPSTAGTRTLTITVRAGNTGEVVHERTRDIEVRESAPPPDEGGQGCTSNADCPSGFVCQDGQCVERSAADDGPLEQAQTILIILAVIAGLLAVGRVAG